MSDLDTDEQDQQIAAFMMASAGLKPADIARALRVHEQQVRQWLSHEHENRSNNDDSPKTQ